MHIRKLLPAARRVFLLPAQEKNTGRAGICSCFIGNRHEIRRSPPLKPPRRAGNPLDARRRHRHRIAQLKNRLHRF